MSLHHQDKVPFRSLGKLGDNLHGTQVAVNVIMAVIKVSRFLSPLLHVLVQSYVDGLEVVRHLGLVSSISRCWLGHFSPGMAAVHGWAVHVGYFRILGLWPALKTFSRACRWGCKRRLHLLFCPWARICAGSRGYHFSFYISSMLGNNRACFSKNIVISV